MAAGTSRLAVSAASKWFGGQPALDGTSLTLAPGSIHALVGANGAGKSTLVKVVSGFHLPDAGSIFLDGDEVRIRSPHDALSLGIVTVYQDSNLCPDLSVAENVMLGQLASRFGFITPAAQLQQVRRLLARSRVAVDPAVLVSTLSVGQRQLVEVARGLARQAGVMIFDEPTAALTHGESETLFAIIRELRASGVSVIYVSHRMPEIFSLCDTVTVLRDGRDVLTKPIANTTEEELVRAMIGKLPEPLHGSASDFANARPVLRVEKMSGERFREIELTLREGAVLGLYGLVGSGRTEVALAMAGAAPYSGSMTLEGSPFRPRNPRAAYRAGLALVPEDRKRNGLFLEMSLVNNISLPHLRRLSKLGFVLEQKVLALTSRLMERLGVKAPSPLSVARVLSGGNQQKVVFAKSVAMGCAVLIVDEPTQGVDVAGKEEIYRLIREFGAQGVAVLMITSDIEELLRMSDWIAVMREGRKVGELPAGAGRERVMRMASGVGEGEIAA